MTAFERSTVRWTRVAVGVAVLATVFSCLQWRVMEDQLAEMRTGGDDTHKLAISTKEEADLTKSEVDANHIDQRAWLQVIDFRVEPTSAGRPLEAVVGIGNIGKSVATNVDIKWFDCLNCTESQISYSQYPDNRAGVLPHIIGLGSQPGWESPDQIHPVFHMAIYGAQILDGAKWQRFKDGRDHPIMSGEVTYDDIFNAHHVTRFCIVLTPKDGWQYCASHNYVD